MEVFIKFLF